MTCFLSVLSYRTQEHHIRHSPIHNSWALHRQSLIMKTTCTWLLWRHFLIEVSFLSEQVPSSHTFCVKLTLNCPAAHRPLYSTVGNGLLYIPCVVRIPWGLLDYTMKTSQGGNDKAVWNYKYRKEWKGGQERQKEHSMFQSTGTWTDT